MDHRGLSMPDRPRKRMPNPFYVALTVVSTAFVVTAFAYLMGPSIAQRAADDPRVLAENASAGSFVRWFDRHGPLALAVEFGLMLALGLLAMFTDHRFAPARPPASRTSP
jgi:hypothetical protein